MRFVQSNNFKKALKKLNPELQDLLHKKLELLLEDKKPPSLRYKPVQAYKNKRPQIKEISINMTIRILLQEFPDYIYLITIGGHDMLP